MNMVSRIFDIKLSCGCMISLDGGGALIPCFSEDCKYDKEYKKEWDKEIKKRNV